MGASGTKQGIRPVLMIPLRRCGSHALRLRLNFSPDFYSPYPLHLVDFMPLLPLYGDLKDDSRYFQLLTDLVGLLAFSPVKWDGITIEPVGFFERLRHKPRSIHVVAWEMLLEAGARHGAATVMDKSLDNVHYWRELLELFPEMIFLNVVRDPRAQVSSMNRAIIHDFDTLLNARTWVKAHDQAQSLIAAHPEKVLSIRFEDFVGNQEQVLKKICEFLGIEFLAEMLEIDRSEEAKRISRQSGLWESNCFPPIPANVDKFKKSLSQQEVDTIETLAGKYMDLYGYQRMGSGTVSITEKDWLEAEKRSSVGRQRAWAEMKTAKPQDYILRRNRADYIEMCRQRLLRNSEK
jgi:Sulfotransferase family